MKFILCFLALGLATTFHIISLSETLYQTQAARFLTENHGALEAGFLWKDPNWPTGGLLIYAFFGFALSMGVCLMLQQRKEQV